MKVQDLFEEHRDEYRYRLQGLGIKHLGDGAYADVYAHPNLGHIAVKTFNQHDDTGYVNWLNWAILHQHNRFVPQIIDWLNSEKEIKASYEALGKAYFEEDDVTDIVFMRKLREVKKRDVQTAVKEFVRGSAVSLDDLYSSHDFEEFGRDEYMLIAETTPDDDVAEIAEFFARNDRHLDLHYGNMMMQGKQLVFTDPFAE